MKKALKISGWSLFGIIVIVVLGFAENNYIKINTIEPEIEIQKPGGHSFVTEEKILTHLSDLGYSFEGQSLGEIELERIEAEVEEIPVVKNAEVFKYTDGHIKLEIEQRFPLARIIAKDGLTGCYIDEEGEIIPLSKDYMAKVPVFSGFINSDLVAPVSQQNTFNGATNLIDDIYKLAKHIGKDEFWKAQIVQVYINSKKEFELIPRVGSHRIMFGSAENIEDKLFRLKTLYTGGKIDVKELNLYDTLNVKYNDQIVCSKK